MMSPSGLYLTWVSARSCPESKMGLMLLCRKRRRRWRGGGGDGEYVEFRDDWFLNRLLVLEWAAHALAEPGTSVNGTA